MPDIPVWSHTTARNSGIRQDTWNVIVKFQGNTMGFWDKRSGGELDSEELKYYPGGMLPPVSLGGRRTVGNLTLQRLYDIDDDHAQIDKLIAGVGFASMTVTARPRDINAEARGQTIIWNGTLKRVTFPEVDSESNAAALIEIEIVVKGYPTTT